MTKGDMCGKGGMHGERVACVAEEVATAAGGMYLGIHSCYQIIFHA